MSLSPMKISLCLRWLCSRVSSRLEMLLTEFGIANSARSVLANLVIGTSLTPVSTAPTHVFRGSITYLARFRP